MLLHSVQMPRLSLTSSFAPEHLQMNVTAASEVPDAGFAAMVERALRGERRDR